MHKIMAEIMINEDKSFSPICEKHNTRMIHLWEVFNSLKLPWTQRGLYYNIKQPWNI